MLLVSFLMNIFKNKSIKIIKFSSHRSSEHFSWCIGTFKLFFLNRAMKTQMNICINRIIVLSYSCFLLIVELYVSWWLADSWWTLICKRNFVNYIIFHLCLHILWADKEFKMTIGPEDVCTVNLRSTDLILETVEHIFFLGITTITLLYSRMVYFILASLNMQPRMIE